MADMDANDIIIVLAGFLSKHAKQDNLTIVFADTDERLKFPAGSTEKHLAEAAKDAGLEIARKGSTRASLRRISDVPTSSSTVSW